MARIDEHPDVGRDMALGKPSAIQQTPWDSVQPDQLAIEQIRSSARRQLSGTGRMTDRELREAVARLLLADG